MIKIKKTFYAIGQGCFYSEKIYFNNEVKTIVYDCGSVNIERLEKEISLSGLNTIDFLILSHFHKDHINGIEVLKNQCKIINVIIPKIDALDVAFYLGSKNTIEEILINPTNFWGDTKIFSVNPNNDGQVFESINNLPQEISHISQFPIIEFNKHILWVLKFYVDKREFLNNNLSDIEKELITNTLKITDYEANKDKLVEVYRKLSKKDVNLTSMSMISSPKRNIWFHENHLSISIMNGDLLLNNERKINLLVNHFLEFSNYTFDFHVPHHGSHKNLFRPINEWITKKAIILSGYDNQYGHPSGIILRKFFDSKIEVKSLTEFDRNYIMTQIYWI